MTEINLLPWRETLRENVKKEWFLWLGAILMLAIFILVTVCTVLQIKIRHALRVNNALHYKINVLSPEVLRVEMIQKQKNSLAIKIMTLRSLQQERFEVVSVLAPLLSKIPFGLALSGIRKKDQEWHLEGVSESPLRVSLFIQYLANIPLLSSPRLVQLNTEDSTAHRFDIVFRENVAGRDLNDAQ